MAIKTVQRGPRRAGTGPCLRVEEQRLSEDQGPVETAAEPVTPGDREVLHRSTSRISARTPTTFHGLGRHHRGSCGARRGRINPLRVFRPGTPTQMRPARRRIAVIGLTECNIMTPTERLIAGSLLLRSEAVSQADPISVDTTPGGSVDATLVFTQGDSIQVDIALVAP